MAKKVSNYRYENLEGLRGIAAIAVVVFHSLYIFFPFMMEGDSTYGAVAKASFENFMYGNPLSALFSGGFAVSIFFVLSGFVLSISFMRKRDEEEVRKLALKRYLRLMPPAAVSIGIAFLLLSLGLMKNQEASIIMNNYWFGSLWNFPPNIFDALYQAFWGVYTSNQVSYNSVLWTMQYEFLGSFLIFGTLLIFGKLKIRWLVYLVLIIAFWNTWYLGFILGALIAESHTNNGALRKMKQFRYWPILLMIGLFLGGYPKGPVSNTVYEYFKIGFISPLQNFSLWLTLGSALIVLCAIYWAPLVKILSIKFLSHFGKLTYSLYLTHKFILVTFTSYLIVFFTNRGYETKLILFLALPISFVLMYSVALIFTKYIDIPSIKLARRFCKYVLSRNPVKASR